MGDSSSGGSDEDIECPKCGSTGPAVQKTNEFEAMCRLCGIEWKTDGPDSFEELNIERISFGIWTEKYGQMVLAAGGDEDEQGSIKEALEYLLDVIDGSDTSDKRDSQDD